MARLRLVRCFVAALLVAGAASLGVRGWRNDQRSPDMDRSKTGVPNRPKWHESFIHSGEKHKMHQDASSIRRIHLSGFLEHTTHFPHIFYSPITNLIPNSHPIRIYSWIKLNPISFKSFFAYFCISKLPMSWGQLNSGLVQSFVSPRNLPGERGRPRTRLRVDGAVVDATEADDEAGNGGNGNRWRKNGHWVLASFSSSLSLEGDVILVIRCFTCWIITDLSVCQLGMQFLLNILQVVITLQYLIVKTTGLYIIEGQMQTVAKMINIYTHDIRRRNCNYFLE